MNVSDINKVNKPIFVTFDDGMKNNMNAFHVLQKLKDDTFKPTATEYMIVDNVDVEGSLSTSEIKRNGRFRHFLSAISYSDACRLTENYKL